MKSRQKHEFGDFQTPDDLAASVVSALESFGINPAAIVEPTCGRGNVLFAATSRFYNASVAYGIDINPDHLAAANARAKPLSADMPIHFRQADMFNFDWNALLQSLPEPLLIIGNPPWVTASDLGMLNSGNLPIKANLHGLSGLDALTGKSNFDIAEWLLLRLLALLNGRKATLALLVKESVARKVLASAWMSDAPIESAAMLRFDAKTHFNAAVDACVFVLKISSITGPKTCAVSDLRTPKDCIQIIGSHRDILLSDQSAFTPMVHLLSDSHPPDALRWRSGIKHDCSKAMEFTRVGSTLLNGLGEQVSLEEDFVYPMLKGSQVAGSANPVSTRAMLVPQTHTGADTDGIALRAPRTWKYLNDHKLMLDGRTSSIYQKRSRFSIFGVGEYSFKPWKLAICSLYKKIHFALVGPFDGKPVVFDDTVYHLSFDTERQARIILSILNSDKARNFLASMIFWDSKRPITTEILHRLDILAAARELQIEFTSDDSFAYTMKPRFSKKISKSPITLFS